MPKPYEVAGLIIPSADLQVSFSRSGGPGGQHVNKTDTQAHLRLDLKTTALPEAVKNRLRERFPGKISKTDELLVSSSVFRVQSRNLADALRKLGELIEQCLEAPKVRRPHRSPSRASKRRRLEAKSKNSEKKSLRSRVGYE